jgi:selenocysteine-specific elongation factor
MDARLRVLTSESEPLAHWTPVHVHLGTRDVPGRVAISGESRLPPGESGYVQIVLQDAVSALHGDRFVVRDQSARRTIGGGIILDPFAPARKRRADLRLAELGVMERRSPAQILSGLLDLRESGVDLPTLSRALNLSPEQAAAMRHEANPVVIGTARQVAVSRASADLLTTRILGALREFHRLNPQVVAMPVDALREAAQSSLPASVFQYFVRELANRQFVVLTHETVRLKEHESTVNADDQQLWARVRRRLTRAGVKVPLVPDLATQLQVSEQVLRDFLHRKSRTGDVLRVGGDRFCLREVLAQLAATAAELSRSLDSGYFSAGQFRDAIGTGRGLAIHYLEFFDALGITRRSGDLRCVRKDFAVLLGPAEPLPSVSTQMVNTDGL